MNKTELIKTLRKIRDENSYEETGHVEADKALLDFISDEEVTKAFKDIKKWYS